MSMVTSVIVTCHPSDAADFLAAWASEHDQDFHRAPDAGGSKPMDFAVLTAGFDHIDIDKVTREVFAHRWGFSDAVSVFAAGESDVRMTERTKTRTRAQSVRDYIEGAGQR